MTLTPPKASTAALGAVILLSLAAGPAASGPAQPPATAIVNATIFDGAGSAPYVGSVVIRDGRIAAIGPRVRPPRGARVLDARGETLLPGLFDVHTHWTPGGSPAATPAIADAYLASGVTTVNDFHQQPEAFAPRRQWLARIPSPHVNFAARISTPGGHGADWADVATTKWVNTPESARVAVADLAPYKPDVIKIFTDGWRYGASADNTSMDVRTLAAAVEEAHRRGLSILTHTVTVGRGADAGKARVDVIAHSLQDRLIDADAVAAIKAGGTAYTGTLAVYEPVKPGRPAPANLDDPAVKARFAKFEFALKNLKTLHDAGVPIVLGTDAGMPGTLHGVATLRELELMVRAGLTPTQALLAGTANSARALGQLADRGTLEPGKRADMVLVKGAPWVDISDIYKTDRVLIDGKLVYGPGAPQRAPSPPAPPSLRASAGIDDFERADGRTSLDTLRTDDPDGGVDRTVQVSQVIDRDAGHALSVSARLSVKPNATAAVIIPLSRGAVTPVDARAFSGLKLETRGAGPVRLALRTLNGRWSLEIPAGGAWRPVSAPFSAFTSDRGGGEAEEAGTSGAAPAFNPAELLAVEVRGGGAAGRKIWFELDNLAFY